MPKRAEPPAAVRECGGRSSSTERFRSRADIERFFAACDALEGPGVEPDWEEHLEVINESRSRGVPTPPTRISTREFRHER